ncbi:hypothetical protein [Mesorhizobium sp. J428]|uniref:hypothetical protein n=1 Tax=Mesorhizobium sp. J428 TaxID=2898440 RepID=UPI00215073C3|nr:hypothetical protein [Mesorhizobium sp. J428]MCR5859784.1 hypothetical protein [Mesorhizobium sp. J428]
MRIAAAALCFVLALAVPARALEDYASLVHRCVSSLKADRELRAAATTAGVKVLRIVFTVDANGRIGKVDASGSNASVNLRKMVERKFRSLPRMMPPPGGKGRRFVIELVV